MQGQFDSGTTMDTASKEGENNNNNKDWINGLPDCILSSILSLLNFQDAMDSVPMVCRRWRGLDPMLKRVNLEFDIANIYGVTDERLLGDEDEINFDLVLEDFPTEDFIRRVNKVLRLYHDKKVDSFKVTFFLDAESTDTLDEWVRFALTKAVSVLDLHLYFCKYGHLHHKRYFFPCETLSELNASACLRNLSLTRCVLRPPLGFDGFNQLTSLYLYDVIFDPSFFERLCSECLFLESLTVRDCPLGPEFILHNPSLPRLKNLNLVQCGDVQRVDVSLPNLAYMEVLYASMTTDFEISIKRPHLTRMSMLVVGGDNNLCRKLTQFAAFPGLETLHLLLMGTREIPQSVPTFRDLKKLYLDFQPRNADLLAVISILKATPLLEELILSLFPYEFCPVVSDFCGFTHDGLRKVHLQGFRSMPCEIEFAVCLLKNTTKLEIMIINPFGKIYAGAGVWEEIEYQIYKYNADWEVKGRAIAQDKLEQVETDARVIIM